MDRLIRLDTVKLERGFLFTFFDKATEQERTCVADSVFEAHDKLLFKNY